VAKTMLSVASVVKWSQRQRALGGPAARKMGGYRPYLVADAEIWVIVREEQRDLHAGVQFAGAQSRADFSVAATNDD
jgi:hypothetical protein